MAFQTSCAAVGGLNCLPDVVADDEGRELVQHGSALFPIACYEEDLKSYSVAWHWHEEFEYILAVKGPLAVDVSKARLILQTGQGVFVNSGVLHAVEQAEKYRCGFAERLSEINAASGKEYQVQVGFGVYSASISGVESIDGLIELADRLMYSDKAKHKRHPRN